MENNTSYLAQLLTPSTRKTASRKVWAIDLENVIVPALTAGNAVGDSAIPNSALGCPLRLAYDKTGQVRFSQAGRPLVRVAKEISNAVTLMRENVVASLVNYTDTVVKAHPEEYKAQIALNIKAGEPIKRYDNNQLASALKAKAEADAKAAADAIAAADAKAEAVAEAEAVAKPKAKSKDKELVHA